MQPRCVDDVAENLVTIDQSSQVNIMYKVLLSVDCSANSLMRTEATVLVSSGWLGLFCSPCGELCSLGYSGSLSQSKDIVG